MDDAIRALLIFGIVICSWLSGWYYRGAHECRRIGKLMVGDDRNG